MLSEHWRRIIKDGRVSVVFKSAAAASFPRIIADFGRDTPTNRLLAARAVRAVNASIRSSKAA